MPTIGKQVSVYILDENMDKWMSLKNRSKWVNDCLSGEEADFERHVKQIMKEVLPEILEELRGGY